jgi:hypothetical protein
MEMDIIMLNKISQIHRDNCYMFSFRLCFWGRGGYESVKWSNRNVKGEKWVRKCSRGGEYESASYTVYVFGSLVIKTIVCTSE